MFDHLENKGMLDAIMLDYAIFKLRHAVWNDQHELWRKFIRSV